MGSIGVIEIIIEQQTFRALDEEAIEDCLSKQERPASELKVILNFSFTTFV